MQCYQERTEEVLKLSDRLLKLNSEVEVRRRGSADSSSGSCTEADLFPSPGSGVDFSYDSGTPDWDLELGKLLLQDMQSTLPPTDTALRSHDRKR